MTPSQDEPRVPMNPAYGLADETRMAALAFAAEHGVKAAAEEFGLNFGTIYKWRRIIAHSRTNNPRR